MIWLEVCVSSGHIARCFLRSVFKKHGFFQPGDAAEGRGTVHGRSSTLTISKSEPYMLDACLGKNVYRPKADWSLSQNVGKQVFGTFPRKLRFFCTNEAHKQ